MTYTGISFGLNFSPAFCEVTILARSQLHSQLFFVIPKVSNLLHGIKSVDSSLKWLPYK